MPKAGFQEASSLRGRQNTCRRMFSSFMSRLTMPFLWQKSVPMMMCWKNHLHVTVVWT